MITKVFIIMNSVQNWIIISLFTLEGLAVRNYIRDVSKNESIIMSILGENKLQNMLMLRRQGRHQTNIAKLPGPKRTRDYNPNYGYEPYWPNSDWVFANDTGVCAKKCPKIYVKYGAICGRNRYFNHTSFKNYCEMQNSDCERRKGWLIAYRGNCTEKLKTMATVPETLVSNAEHYIHEHFKKYP